MTQQCSVVVHGKSASCLDLVESTNRSCQDVDGV